jgi:hypothetical protein
MTYEMSQLLALQPERQHEQFDGKNAKMQLTYL